MFRNGFPRWLKRCAIGLGILAAIVIALPTVLAKTPLRSWLVSKATSGMPITVSIRNLSLAWWSPIEVDDVQVADLKGEKIVQVEHLATEHTLFGLLVSSRDLGVIRVDKPIVDVRFTKNSSNIEAVLAELKHPEPKESKPEAPASHGVGRSVTLEIVDGLVNIADDETKRSWKIEKLDAKLALNDATLSGQIKSALTGEPTPGNIDITLEGQMAPTLKGKMRGKLEAIPLILAAPIVRRSQPDMVCTGQLHGDTTIDFEAGAGGMTANLAGQIRGSDLFAGGGPLGGDRVQLKQFTAPIKLAYTGKQLRVEQADLTCDFGKLAIKGTLPLDQPVLAGLASSGATVSGEFDLARIAQQLPNTLKLHKDVTLTTGSIKIDCQTVASANGPALQGSVFLGELRGTRGGREIAWQDPVKLSFSARQSDKTIVDIDNLDLSSRFVNLKGSANANNIRMNGDANLGELAGPLGQFIDLGSYPLSGKADLAFNMTQDAAGTLQFDASAKLVQFQLGPWREENLVLKGQGSGQAKNAGEKRIDKGALQISSGGDLLNVMLREPFTVGEKGMAGAVYAKLEGDLARWQLRARPIAAMLGDLNAQGQANIQAWIALTPNNVDVQMVILDAQNLNVKYGAYNIQDPKMTLQATGRFNQKDNILDLGKSQFTSQALVFNTEKFRVDLNRKALAGSVAFSGDLGRLQTWMGKAPTADPIAGVISGQADLNAGDEGFDLVLKSTIANLNYGPAAKPKFSDPLVKLDAKGKYVGKNGSMALDQFQLVTQMIGVQGQARIANLAKTMDVDVQGTLSYDLAKFEPTAKTFLGETASIQGKDQRPFKLIGPLRPKGDAPDAAISFASLQGEAGVNWATIHAYGADVGAGDVKMKLQSGWLKLDPVVSTLNQGKLTLAASVRLEPAPMELLLPTGPFVENAKITPEMCSSGLGYALPMLANVASAEGELSILLEGGRIPLSDPKQGDLRGTLKLHNAKVGPGPLVQKLSSMLTIPPPYSVIRENAVKIWFEKGRVNHENLVLVFPENFTVTTSGSVGVDGTLSIVAEMPIPTKLLGNFKLPTGMAQQTIKVPIGGTVKSPQIDPRAFQQILAQAGAGAIGNVGNLGNLIGGGNNPLGGLFGPKKQ